MRSATGPRPVLTTWAAVGSVIALLLAVLAGCTTASPGVAQGQDPGTTAAADNHGPVTVGPGSEQPSSVADPSSADAPSAGPSSSGGSIPSSTASTPTPAPKPTPTVIPPVAVVSSSPEVGAAGLSPLDPITVTVAKGTIAEVALINPTGYSVKGTLSKDKTSWATAEVLGFGKTYQLSGSAVGTDGKKVPLTGSYTIVNPKNEVRTTISPGDKAVVGVAMPIQVTFAVEPTDRALIEKHVSVTTDPEVKGAWAWIQHDGGAWGLDYRPKGYWPEGTKVHVEADLYGLRFAAGAYGKTDITSDFSIGRNQVVKANSKSHQIVVQQDGKTVATYKASFGSSTDDRETRSGIHVVNDKFADKLMVSQRFHYRQQEKWAVRISNNGEFIHANPKTVNAQGTANVSHGCVNLSPTDAKKYFDSAVVGDPVEVTGSGVKLGPQDGDIFDYAIDWDTWLSLSALN
jgi:lipoprotein-anchoring transpeptidase ErfK/SrfK